MKHLKVAEWIELGKSPIVGEVEQLPASVKEDKLRDVAQAFAKNCQRLFRLTHLLTTLFEAGKRGQHEIARHQVAAATRTYSDLASPPQVGSRPPIPGLPFEGITVRGAYVPLDATAVQSVMETMGDPAATDAVELLMSMQIVGAWSAYEILAGDVWLAAVNARPGSLGVNAWTSAKDRKPDYDEPEQPTTKAISLDAIRKIDFDLAHRFGEIVRREFGFNALDGIAKAYQAAFRVVQKGKVAVPEAVKAWFRGKDFDDLRVLESLRHATVHRGGLADPIFLERVKNDPEFSSLPPNSPIPIDGVKAKRYTEASVSCARSLITGVDEWLAKNP